MNSLVKQFVNVWVGAGGGQSQILTMNATTKTLEYLLTYFVCRCPCRVSYLFK